MSRTFAASGLCALAMAGLVGCGSGDSDDGSARAGTASSSTVPRTTLTSSSPQGSPSPSPTGTAPADGSDVKKCVDGQCEVAVSKPVSIKINRRLGISLVEIEKISRGESVTMVLVSPINDYRIIAGPGDANSVNKITVQVKQIKGNKAIIALSVKN